MAFLAQFDEELLEHVINPCCYDANGWQCLNDGTPP